MEMASSILPTSDFYSWLGDRVRSEDRSRVPPAPHKRSVNWRSLVKSYLLPALAAILLGSTATAQTQSSFWNRADGGDFNDPANWTPFGVPGVGDRAVFDLPGERYSVLSNSIDLSETSVGRSDVGLIPLGNADFEFGLLEIIGGELTSGEEDLLRPGRLRLLGSGFSNAFNIDLGSGMRPSQLVLGPNHALKTDTFSQTNAAALNFKLSANSPNDPFAPRLRVEFSNDLAGSVNVRAGDSGYPAVGTIVDLIETDAGFGTGDLQLLSFAPRNARTLSFSVDSNPSRLLATVENIEGIVDLEPIDEDIVAANPTELAADDFDNDLIPELVVLLPTGKVLVYPGSATGLFLTPTEYSVGSNPVGIATGDFDRDGTKDIAVISRDSNLLELLLNPASDPTALTTGPSFPFNDDPVSIAPVVFPSDSAFAATSTGVTVAVKDSRGRGTVKSLETGVIVITELSEVDVGEEPGPTDPIDDEGKKDESTDAVGVGGTSTALMGEFPVLQILEILPVSEDGIDLLRSIPLSGRPIDLASGDVDLDGVIDTFVVTSNGQLNHLTPFVAGSVARSIPLEGTPRAITIADLDLDGFQEIVIALGEQNSLVVFRAMPATPAGGTNPLGLILEEVSRIPLDRFTTDIVATPADTTGIPGRVFSGLQGSKAGTFGFPGLTLRDYELSVVPACVFADLNGDAVVNGIDVGALIASWGLCGGCAADLNGNGTVDSADLGLLFSAWGPCNI